jgi:F420-non-reducing hydrogenase small subunit
MLTDMEYATTIFDNRELPKVDCVLIEGAVRTEEDLQRLKEAREKAELLVAMGTCASYGGIQGLGNLYPTDEILSIVSKQEENPFFDAPALENRVNALDMFVDVDYFIPGCPPSETVLNMALPIVLSGKKHEMTKEHRLPVCAECDRNIEHQTHDKFEGITTAKREVCLLSQGYICLGSVTRSGCSAQCPTTNSPCSGCRGPTDAVLLKPTHTIFRDFVARVVHFSGRNEEDVVRELRSIPWRFFPFTFASEALKRKPYSKILELQAPLWKEGGK